MFGAGRGGFWLICRDIRLRRETGREGASLKARGRGVTRPWNRGVKVRRWRAERSVGAGWARMTFGLRVVEVLSVGVSHDVQLVRSIDCGLRVADLSFSRLEKVDFFSSKTISSVCMLTLTVSTNFDQCVGR